ncbi:MAG: diguanylate cyclase [Desulfamplus sp.]|nr:diguanylate cyclase [Desulfamplus sp.]
MELTKGQKKIVFNFVSLKTRVLIIFSLLTLFFLAVNYWIQKAVIFPTYLALEESEALQNLDRASEAIEREIKHIDILCHDWASWDDTYNYAVSKSKAFEESNLTAGSFISNKINVVYICDANGNFLWEAVYDLNMGKNITMKNILNSPSLKKKLVNFSMDSFPKYYSIPDKLFTSGIVNTEHGLLMVASRPILTSSNQGPARGALIMGRFLDNSFVKHLTLQTRVDFNIISLYDKDNIIKYERVISKLKENSIEEQSLTQRSMVQNSLIEDSPYYLERIDDNALVVYSRILDIEENPAMIISFAFPREISRQGIKTIHFALVYILLVGIVVLILFLCFTNVMILKPLLKLTILIQSVENTGDLSIRSPVEREDEIGILSACFNRMMDKTESQSKELSDAIKIQQKEIEKRKEAEEELQLANTKLVELANIDHLTGIANRRYFGKVIEHEWKRGAREKSNLSIILCDIDYFKLYNDTYGHQQGDECLKAVASAINSSLRRPPDIAARFGGEEFIALLPNTDIEGAFYLAEKMRITIQELRIPHSASSSLGLSDFVSISLGVASSIPDHTKKHEELIEMADNALYKSKESGRNRATKV